MTNEKPKRKKTTRPRRSKAAKAKADAPPAVKKKRPSRAKTVSVQELAESLGVSTKTVRDFWVPEGAPHTRRNGQLRFRKDRVLEWLAVKRPNGLKENGTAKDNGAASVIQPDPINQSLRETKLRIDAARAEKIELDNALKRQELVLRHEVSRALVAKVIVCRKRLLNMVPTVAAQTRDLDTRAREAVIRRHLEVILQDFAKGIDGVEVTDDDFRDARGLFGLD